MLVIPRKKNESLVIGDGIIVTVIEIRDDSVRLGIEAPNKPLEVTDRLSAERAAVHLQQRGTA